MGYFSFTLFNLTLWKLKHFAEKSISLHIHMARGFTSNFPHFWKALTWRLRWNQDASILLAQYYRPVFEVFFCIDVIGCTVTLVPTVAFLLRFPQTWKQQRELTTWDGSQLFIAQITLHTLSSIWHFNICILPDFSKHHVIFCRQIIKFRIFIIMKCVLLTSEESLNLHFI